MYTYSVRSTKALAAATTQTLLVLKPAAAVPIKLKALDCSFDGAAAAAGILVQLIRQSTDGTGAASPPTPQKKDSGDRAAQATILHNLTAEGTLDAILKEWYVSPFGGLIAYQWPLGEEFQAIENGNRLAIRVITPASVSPNCAFGAEFEEQVVHLVLVPQFVDETLPLFPCKKPVLPATLERVHGWGQASSDWAQDGKVCLWVRATQVELDLIAGTVGCRVIGRAAPDAEGDRMVSAMREGDKTTSRDEFLSAYRATAIPEEDALRRQRGIAHALALASVVGVGVAVCWLAQFLGLPVLRALDLLVPFLPVGIPLGVGVAHHFDNANFTSHQNVGTQGGPEGDYFSDAKGRWWVDRAGVDIVDNANLGFRDNVACRAWDARCPIINKGRATGILVVPRAGVAARMAASLQYSFTSNLAGTATQLHKNQYGTQLGSDGTLAIPTDKLGISAEDSSIQGELNDGVVVGPVTDTELPTGRLGIMGDGTTPDVVVGKINDFRTEVPYEAITAHPVEFVAAGTEGSAASGNVTPGLPAGLRANDILICTMHSSDQVSHSMNGTYWTQIVQGNGGGTTSRLSVWYHRYDGSTGPDRLVTHAAGQSPIAGIVAYRGCKLSGSPVDVVSAITGGTDASIEHASILPANGAFILLINGAADDNTRTVVSGYAARYVDGAANCFITTLGTPDGSVCVMDRAAPGGPTGIVTMTQSASDAWASVFLALKPQDEPVVGAEPVVALQSVARAGRW